MPSASPQSASRASPSARPPNTQTSPDTPSHTAMRWKDSYRARTSPAKHQTTKRVRPTCIAA